jgi:hypothetical protein
MALLLDTGGGPAILEDSADSEVRARATGPPQRTLDDVLSEVWESLLAAAAPVPCPVCGVAMTPRWSAGAGVVGGRCGNCGSALS